MANWNNTTTETTKEEKVETELVREGQGLTPEQTKLQREEEKATWSFQTWVTEQVKQGNEEVTESTPTPDDQAKSETNIADSALDAGQLVSDLTQEEITRVTEDTDTLKESAEEKKRELEASALDREELAIDEAKETTQIINEANKNLAKLEQESIDVADQAKDEALALTEKKRKASIDEAEAAIAKQKLEDERAISQAKQSQEVSRLKSLVAFNRLWLSASASAIWFTQHIYTQWANKLAELKVQSNHNIARNKLDLAEIELWFVQESNDIIQNHANAVIKIKQQGIERIKETKTQLLKTEFAKNKEIRGILDDLAADKEKVDRQLRTDFQTNVDRTITLAEWLQSQFNKDKELASAEFNQKANSWAFFNYTTKQKTELADQMGMTVAELDNLVTSQISTAIRGMFDEALWDDYAIGNMDTMINKVIDLMTNSWYDVNRALREVVTPIITGTDEYKQGKKDEAVLSNLELQKKQLEVKKLQTQISSLRQKANSTATPKQESIDWGLVWIVSAITKWGTFSEKEQTRLAEILDSWDKGAQQMIKDAAENATGQKFEWTITAQNLPQFLQAIEPAEELEPLTKEEVTTQFQDLKDNRKEDITPSDVKWLIDWLVRDNPNLTTSELKALIKDWVKDVDGLRFEDDVLVEPDPFWDDELYDLKTLQ